MAVCDTYAAVPDKDRDDPHNKIIMARPEIAAEEF